MREPVHVLDPCRSGDMNAGQDERAGVLVKVVRYSHHHEVLSSMETRCLRFRSDRPADRVHSGAASRFDLHFDEAPLSALCKHREDVGAF